MSKAPQGGISNPFLSPSGELIFDEYIFGDQELISRVYYIDLLDLSSPTVLLAESTKVTLAPALLGRESRGAVPTLLYFSGDFDFTAKYNPVPVRNLVLSKGGVEKIYKEIDFFTAGSFCQGRSGEVFALSSSVKFPYSPLRPSLGDSRYEKLYRIVFGETDISIKGVYLEGVDELEITSIQSGVCFDQIFATTLPLNDNRPETLVEYDSSNGKIISKTELPDSMQVSRPFVIDSSRGGTRLAMLATPNLRSTEPIGALTLLTLDLPETRISQTSLHIQQQVPVIEV